MIYVCLEEFYKLINSIGFLANATVTFYSLDLQCLPSDPTNYHPEKKEFCSIINKTLVSECKKSDSCALANILKSNDNFLIYKCHMGLIEIAFKISSPTSLLGYAIIGPFRDPATEMSDLKNLEPLSKKTNTDYEELKKAFYDIEQMNEQKLYAIKNLLITIFDFMKIKNYISQTDDFFTNQIVPFIQSNFKNKLSIDLLCEKFSVSTKTLYHLFEIHAQQTPKQFILNARIKEAIRLLTTTDLPIAAIAELVGFDDYIYFTKAFKRLTNNPPTFYRKTKNSNFAVKN